MLQRLDVKLVLAAISGALVSLHYDNGISFDDEMLSFLFFYGVAGALFAIPILGPYLRHDPRWMLRGIALVCASALSFWCALNTAGNILGNPTFRSLGALPAIVASIVGAGIVFAAAQYGVSFNWSRRYGLLGAVSAVVGGWVFDLLADGPGPEYLFSFIAWHCIVCAGLHFGTRPIAEPRHA
jgi:hypothetical protein